MMDQSYLEIKSKNKCESSEEILTSDLDVNELLTDAMYAIEMSNYNEALEQLFKIKTKLIHSNNEVGLAKYYHLMAFLASKNGLHSTSLKYNLKALNQIKKSGQLVCLGAYPIEVYLLNNIGHDYDYFGKYNLALNAFEDAIKKESGFGRMMKVILLTNMAQSCARADAVNQAYVYLLEAFNARNVSESKTTEEDLCLIYMTYGVIHKKTEAFEAAILFFDKALVIARKYKNHTICANVLWELAELYEMKSEYDRSEHAALEALDIQCKLGLSDFLIRLYALLMRLKELKDEWHEALLYSKLLTKAEKDSLSRNIDIQLRFIEIEKRLELAEQRDSLNRQKNVELKIKADELMEKTLALECARKRLSAISQMGQSITSKIDLEMIFKEFHDGMKSLIGKSDFLLGLCNQSSDDFYIQAYYLNSMNIIENEDLKSNEFSFNITGKCCDYPFISDELYPLTLNLPKWLESVFTSSHASGFLYQPLQIDTDVLGAIIILCDRSDVFNQSDLDIVQSLSIYVSIAVKNAQQSNDLKSMVKKLEYLSVTDALTGLFNRRHFHKLLENEKARAMRYSHEYAVILLDVDFFKKINDTFGHDCGDYVLVTLSSVLKEKLRKEDTLARWGGEEFIVLLPETNAFGAMELAERLRHAVERTSLEYYGKPINVTITLGVSIYKGEVETEAIIQRADHALYEGKALGRNRAIIV